ncbi:MAG: DNA repair protein RadC [Chitinophagaceae bacterium]|nr:DNA repair protein RadC [Chitinophagaceae bacterium]
MKENLSIKKWAQEDRPREKLQEKGCASLSNSEVLAILINTGTLDKSALDIAKDLLLLCDQNLLELGKLSLNDFQKVKGIGEKKAVTLVAAIELGRRRQLATAIERPKITSSLDTFNLIAPYLLDKQVEQFYVMFLSQGNKLVAIEPISHGGLTSTVVDCRVIFKKALEFPIVTQIILSHNHPSGNLRPSEADKVLTQKIKEAGLLLDIRLLDHLIIGDNAYFSFADEGMI